MKSLRKIFSTVLERLNKPIRLIITSFVLSSVLSVNAFATATEPKLVSGTLELIKKGTGWLTLIVGGGAALFLGYLALCKALTEDQAVIAEKNKLMKNTVKSSVIAVSATGLITLILSFYT